MRIVAAFLLLIGLSIGHASAASILPPGKNCFYDATGYPLANGTAWFYSVGTTTLKSTWQDKDHLVANRNPVPLDSAGCGIIYGYGTYRQVLKDTSGSLIWDQTIASPAIAGVSWGGTSYGPANAQQIGADEFYGGEGQVVAFLAGVTNTGPTTLATAHLSAKNVLKDTSSGAVALTGGEIYASQIYTAAYDATGQFFHLLNGSPYKTIFQSFTGSAAWVKPGTVTSGSVVHAECWGGGGGGGGFDGGKGSGAGGAGGGGGGYSDVWLSAASLPATVPVIVGLGGSQGSNLVAASPGGSSSFGSFLTAYGGGGGFGFVPTGLPGSGGGGGGGGGETSAGSNGTGTGGGVGGGPWLVAAQALATVNPPSMSGGPGGTSSATDPSGGESYFGGGGGGSQYDRGNGGNSVWGGGGGAGGTWSSAFVYGTRGTSVRGGNGGGGSPGGAVFASVPGGGGGANQSGADGQCNITTFP